MVLRANGQLSKNLLEKHTPPLSQCSQPGQLKLDGYFTYENVSSNREGGGVSISALKELHPALVSDGGKYVEALTIDIFVKNMTISVTSAYGPQESALNEKKNMFWQYLHNKAHRAKS